MSPGVLSKRLISWKVHAHQERPLCLWRPDFVFDHMLHTLMGLSASCLGISVRKLKTL